MFNPWWTRNKLFKFLFRIFWIQLSILICRNHEIVFQTKQSTLSKLDSTFYEKILKTNIYLILFKKNMKVMTFWTDLDENELTLLTYYSSHGSGCV
jgi:hypothetical protein